MQCTLARRGGLALAVALITLAPLAGCSDDETAPTSVPPTSGTVPGSSTTAAPTTAPSVVALSLAYVEPPAGLLGDLATAQRRGLEDALVEINTAGGVLGGSVAASTITEPRSGDAGRAVTDARAAGAHAIVGPAGSTSAAAMIPALDATSLVACSGSATAPSLSSADVNGRLFCTAVSDEHLIGHLVDVLAERVPAGGTVSVVARDDSYGAAVGGGLANALTAQGIGATVVAYPATTVLFDTTAAAVAASAPSHVVLVSYGEGSELLAKLITAGIAPTSIIGLDGMFTPRLATLAFPTEPSRADGTTIIGATGTRD